MPDSDPVSADSIRARLSQEAADAVDAKLSEWFGRESELGAFDAEAVRELGRRVV